MTSIFSILSGNDNGIFEINTYSGELTVIPGLRIYTNSIHKIVVQENNGGVLSTELRIINLLDRKLDQNDLIQTQVTHPIVPIVDDGIGNYNISPLNFPAVDVSCDSNPTKITPKFRVSYDPDATIVSMVTADININVYPLSGSDVYAIDSVLHLHNQTNPDENGIYQVIDGLWVVLLLDSNSVTILSSEPNTNPYTYDGTENDNKAGFYDGELDSYGNEVTHYRRGYSHAEVAGYLRDNLKTSIEFGRFKGINQDNGAFYKWFKGTDSKVNIGAGGDKSVYISPFGMGSGIAAPKSRTWGDVDVFDIDAVNESIDMNKRLVKPAIWSLSNHQTESSHGRYKSPFVKDWPYIYNTEYNDSMYSGGYPVDLVDLDAWRFTVPTSGAVGLRPICDSSLYYQRDNGYHHNITFDLTDTRIYGRQHVSLLNHLDRADVAPVGTDCNPVGGTVYDAYRNDLVVIELDKLCATSIGAGLYVMMKVTTGSVVKYYYNQRKKSSITAIGEFGVDTWTPTTLLWEDGGSGVLRIYITATEYVEYTMATKSIAEMVSDLLDNNELIPVPFDPSYSNAGELSVLLKSLSVLFIDNSLVDYSDVVHQREKIRSKKAFIHLPTPVNLKDGTTFELDVSLPNIDEQDAFGFNTVGSLSGYKNYVTQPRVYVFGGIQKCYGVYSENDTIKNNLLINTLSRVGSDGILVSNNHGIAIGTSIQLEILGADQSGYNSVHTATISDGNTITFPIQSTTVTPATGDLIATYNSNLMLVSIASLTHSNGIATLSTISPHGINGVEDIIIKLRGANEVGYNGEFLAVVLDASTILFNVDETIATVATGTPIIESIIIAPINNDVREVSIEFPEVDSLSYSGGVCTLTFKTPHEVAISSTVQLTLNNIGQSDVVNISGDGSVVTVETKNAHYLTTSDVVTIYVENGTDIITGDVTVIDSNTFTVASALTEFAFTSIVYFTGFYPYAGEFPATSVTPTTLTYAVSDIPPNNCAIDGIEVYGYVSSDEYGQGTNSVLSGEGIEGLTERDNDYMFSVMPEVEFASSGNLYHQPAMTTDDIKSSDKRVLLACVYPTSTNTFGWRMDNDPQLRLMKWSLMSLQSMTGSAAHMGFLSYKKMMDDYNLISLGVDVGVYNSPISSMSPGISNSVADGRSLIIANTKVKFPDKLTPSVVSDILDPDDVGTVSSLIYQAKRGYNNMLDFFLGGRIAMRDDTSELISQHINKQLGYNDNGSHGSEGVGSLPVGFHDGFLQFNITAFPSSTSESPYRWLNKAIYTPDAIVNAENETYIVDLDGFNNVDSNFKLYLSQNFVPNVPFGSNAGSRYIPGELNATIDDTKAFGVLDVVNDILTSGNVDQVTQLDVFRSLHDYYHTIPNYPELGELYGDAREFSNRFHLSDESIIDIASYANFYQFNWVPFAKIFSTDNIVPHDYILSGMLDYSTIIGGGYSDVNDTLGYALDSNPVIKKFYSDGYDEAFASINYSDETNSHVEEYVRNYITGYSNKMPFRFYNSLRVDIKGDDVSTASSDDRVDRIFKSTYRDYLNQYISTAPDVDVGQYIDDNFSLESYSEISLGTPATGTVTFIGPVMSIGTSITVNGIEFTLQIGASTPGDGTFTYSANLVDIASSLVSQFNSHLAVGLVDITASNVGGTSSVVTFTTGIGVLGNSYSMTTSSMAGELDSTGFSGGTEAGVVSNEVIVNDYNDSHTYFHGSGESAVAKISILDASTLVPSGMTVGDVINVNGVDFVAQLADSVPGDGTFTVVDIIDSISARKQTATNLVNQINSHGNVALNEIVASNYGGDSYYITLKATEGSIGNSYLLTYTPIDVTVSVAIVPFSGGVDGTHGDLHSLITVSGQPYLASRDFYVNKMKYNYVRVKMKFIFSKQLGRWVTLDYRQCATSYLTPSVGNEAFAYKEKSLIKVGTDGTMVSDYHEIDPSDPSSFDNYDYLWRRVGGFNSNEIYKSLESTPYPLMVPMEMNRFALPFMTPTFPYTSTGDLNPLLDSETDPVGAEDYRFMNLVNPPSDINFLTPNSHHGARSIATETDTEYLPNIELNLFQPHLWAFYWHMRPATCAMYGTAIPSPWDRKGGSMADPVLNNMYQFPPKRRPADAPTYMIPWHENMSYDWLWDCNVVIDGAIGNDVARSDYNVIDGIMNGTVVTAGSTGVDPTFDYTGSDLNRTDSIDIDSER